MTTETFIPTKNLHAIENCDIQNFTLNDKGRHPSLLRLGLEYKVTNFRVEDDRVKFCIYNEKGWVASYIVTEVVEFFKSVKFV